LNHRLFPTGEGTTFKEKQGLSVIPRQFKNLEEPEKFLSSKEYQLVYPFQPSLMKNQSSHFQSLRNSLAQSSSVDMKSLASLN
jgi:hypothetical protein